ncbi:hypothetical protein MNEG_3148 [Monoraphidium neglectum]|uniref:Uncharacterized protein n=1 Tax=Monoraphidium neglectum TaxID=145388 RepID=A0A0D2NIR3_9CHLO|nr:hypothetical protein MNEG_3148 [Monoraphidium neglectum]KIZ04811.1 hypothetical protein MNEG_3148 [Monoraphidium neglectum]|eukprot:XP_013903830.1 hypothetical protein MNEG_3148 [Monoraphidium neglectum]
MEAALRQLLSCIDSGRRDAASAALERLQHACRAAASTAAVEVPGERSLDRLLRHLCQAGGSALATKADFITCKSSNWALLALLTVPAVADAFLTEGRVTALIDALEALGGCEEGGAAGRGGVLEMRLWLLSDSLGSVATALTEQRSGPVGGAPLITPAQLALAGVIARPAVVRALLRAALTQQSTELSAGDPLSAVEAALLVADHVQRCATPASHAAPSEPPSSAADPHAAARATWQGADADWLCEALPPLLALRLGEARSRPGTVLGEAELREHAALFVA